MGPPPKYLIDRKLISVFSKKILPKSPLVPSEYVTGLIDCWKKWGVGSGKCADQELKYDFVEQSKKGFKDKVEKLGIKQAVMEEVKRPIYPSEVKGRHYKYHKRQKEIISALHLL